MASIKKGALDGMKITIGVLPIIVVAAIFESFVTRHTEMPVWLSVLILASSLFFIIWYVILYPIHLSRTLKTDNNNAGRRLILNRVRTFGEIIEDSIQFFKQNWKPLLKVLFYYLRIFLGSKYSGGRIKYLLQFLQIGQQAHQLSALTYFMSMLFELFNFLVITLTVLSFIALYKEKG